MSTTRRKNQVNTGAITRIIIILAVVLLIGGAAVYFLRSRVSEQFASGSDDEVQTAQVTVGSISTTVTGSGTLANQESEDTFIDGTIEITEVYVKAGQNVKKGDMLASVNSASVIKAMKDVQAKIDDVDDEIDDLDESTTVKQIKAGVAGRIKKIYAEEGMASADAVYDNKALMLISADGYMAADIVTDALKAGDKVICRFEDGSELEGKVDAVWAGIATILLPDDKTDYDVEVTILKDDAVIGTASTYIHQQVSVTGYTGIVDKIKVKLNDKVNAGRVLLTIKDASSSVNYATLLKERAELEDNLSELLTIYKEGAVFAKADGMVTAITETEDSTTTTTSAGTSMRTSGMTFTTVTEDSSAAEGTTISICPTETITISMSVDETDILSLEVGQTATVTISALGDDTYEGTVTDLDMTGTSSSGVTTYTAEITINKEEGMLNGMSASVEITIEGKDDALLVPADAVHKTRSTYYVYTSYDETAGTFGGMVEVVIGISNKNYTEIVSGLSEGDTVYYTEKEEETFSFGGFSGMPGGFGGGSGGMPSGGFSGGSMPGSSSGSRSGSGSGSRSGSGMPNFN